MCEFNLEINCIDVCMCIITQTYIILDEVTLTASDIDKGRVEAFGMAH